MGLKNESLAGAGYVVLNVIRALNIVGLVAIIAASVALLIKTTTVSSFFFFDAMTNVVAIFSSIFLIVSEVGLFKSYFARVMPLFSPEHGFVTLSLGLFVLGIDLLAKLNHDTDTQTALGLPFWRITISAGILSFILSILNFIANYLFRQPGITARQVRDHGAVARHQPPSIIKSMDEHSTPAPSPRKSLHLVTRHIRDSLPGGNHPFKRSEPVLPTYHATVEPAVDDHDFPPSPTSRYSRYTTASRRTLFPGWRGFGANRRTTEMPEPLPLNVNKNTYAELARPEYARHPSRSGEGEVYRSRA